MQLNNMKRTFLTKAFLPIVVFTIFSCTANDEFQSFDGFEKSKDVSFDIAITRDGKISTRSDGGYGNIVTETDKDAKLDPSKPFGLMGVDPQTYEVLINNQRVFETAGIRSTTFDSRNWHSTETERWSTGMSFWTEKRSWKESKGGLLNWISICDALIRTHPIRSSS